MKNKVVTHKKINAYSKKGNVVGEAEVRVTFFGYGQPMLEILKYNSKRIRKAY